MVKRKEDFIGLTIPDLLADPKILTIPLSEPLWFCEKHYVFPNQCGGDHP